MDQGALEILYEVGRDWTSMVVPIVSVVVWLAAPVIVVVAIRRGRTTTRSKKVGVGLWLVAWITLGGFGLGNVWYQHFRCVSELKSGHAHVIEGVVSNFRPERGKASEQLTVDAKTFNYYSANLAGGGLRWTGGSSSPLRVGRYVRVTYDDDNEILKLELRRGSN